MTKLRPFYEESQAIYDCGWGGALVRAVEKYDVNVIGIARVQPD